MSFPIMPILKKVTDVIPRNGLVAEYLFSGNADDTSGNGYDGVNNGATLTTDRNSNPNSAYSFNGSSDYINIDAALTGLSSNTKGTFSLWVKPVDATPFSPSERLLTFGDTDGNRFIHSTINLTSGTLTSALGNLGLKFRLDTDNQAFSDGVWSHMAFVQDGVSPILYINGVVVDQTFISSVDKTAWFADATGIDNGRIGALNFNSGGNIGYFDGDIDDVRLYDRNLSQAEITILANE